jgi:hypothetical protein
VVIEPEPYVGIEPPPVLGIEPEPYVGIEPPPVLGIEPEPDCPLTVLAPSAKTTVHTMAPRIMALEGANKLHVVTIVPLAMDPCLRHVPTAATSEY